MTSTEQLFTREQIERGINDIFEAQRLIASERIYQVGPERKQEYRPGPKVPDRSGALMEALTAKRYSITSLGSGLTAAVSLPLYIRFLDMKAHGNYQIYNRQVYGILYSDVIRRVRYGYRDWAQRTFGTLITDAFKNHI